MTKLTKKQIAELYNERERIDNEQRAKELAEHKAVEEYISIKAKQYHDDMLSQQAEECVIDEATKEFSNKMSD